MDKPCLVDGSADDFVPRLLFHRNTFTGNSRFIHAGIAAENDTVRRDAFPWTHHHFITGCQFLNGNRGLCPVPDDNSLFRRQIHQLLDGTGCPAFGTGLQPFAESNEGDDHAR